MILDPTEVMKAEADNGRGKPKIKQFYFLAISFLLLCRIICCMWRRYDSNNFRGCGKGAGRFVSGTKQSKSNSDEKTHFKRDKRNVQSGFIIIKLRNFDSVSV